MHDGDIYRNMLGFDLPSPMSTYLVRASSARTVGGFGSGRTFNEDKLFVRKLVRSGYKVRFVPEVVLLKLKHKGQKSSLGKRKWREEVAILREHYQDHRAEIKRHRASRTALLVRTARASHKAKDPGFPAYALSAFALVAPRAVAVFCRHGWGGALSYLRRLQAVEGTAFVDVSTLPPPQ